MRGQSSRGARKTDPPKASPHSANNIELSPLQHNDTSRPVGQALTRSSLERKVLGLNLGTVESNTELLAVRDRCNIFSKGSAMLPGRNDTEMGPANLLQGLA